jgi:hypothetical protein
LDVPEKGTMTRDLTLQSRKVREELHSLRLQDG